MPSVSFPHVTHSTAAINGYEPVVASNYNAHIILMGSLKSALGDYSFLREYIKSVTGLFVEKAAGTIEGGYKTTKFRYDSNEKETFFDVEIAFFNFLDNDSKMFVYNALVALSRQKYNPLTGEKTLKAHYANAALVVEKFNRDGTIYWRRMGHNFFPMGDLPDQMTDYTSHDMQELTLQFNVDWVTDVTNDPRLKA
jgi:hypothetical protein